MRIVEISGISQHPAGQPAASQQFNSAFLGPETAEPQRHLLADQLRGTLAARHAARAAQAHDRQSGRPPGSEAISTARKSGSKHAVDDLTGRLGGDWVLMRGYHNARGPIGQLLLGPAGLVAVTSIYLDSVVHCRGDKWHAEEQQGHQQHLGPAHLDDHEGRSPSTQLNQSADALEQALRSASLPMKVQRAILLNHPAARRGAFTRPTVHVVTSAADLVSWLHTLPKTADRGVRHQLEKLITHGEQTASPTGI